MRSASPDIDIQRTHSRLRDPGNVLLHPLRRPDKTILLGVPGAEHDVAFRLPASLEQAAQGTPELDYDGGAGVGVRGAADDPGVAVVADNDGFVGVGAVDYADGLPDS